MKNSVIVSDIKETIKLQCLNCNSSIYIITAFCTVDGLKYLDSFLPSNIQKRILVRFLPSDIISGATDLEIYSYCSKHDWELFTLDSIHAKILLFDFSTFIIGSANITAKGIGLTDIHNTEAVITMESDFDSNEFIVSQFRNGLLMTPERYNSIVQYVSDQKNKSSNSKSEDFSSLYLYPSDFPTEKTDSISIYSLNSFKWLIDFLSKQENCFAYFGQITEALQKKFTTNPRYPRKEIKEYLADLLIAVESLHIKEISITRPHYSQKITLNVL